MCKTTQCMILIEKVARLKCAGGPWGLREILGRPLGAFLGCCHRSLQVPRDDPENVGPPLRSVPGELLQGQRIAPENLFETLDC